jgi:hypothetical protein
MLSHAITGKMRGIVAMSAFELTTPVAKSAVACLW